MKTIAQIDTVQVLDAQAKTYALARASVAERASSLDRIVRTVTARKIPGIKSALALAADAQANLVATVKVHPELFVKPRTMTLHGVKVGYAKGSGKIDWDDDDAVLKRIDKLRESKALTEEQYDAIVYTERKLSSDGLRALDPKLLSRLGVTLENTGDMVVVKSADTAVDKLVKKILKEGAVEPAEEGAS